MVKKQVVKLSSIRETLVLLENRNRKMFGPKNLACSAGVFFERAICSRHVETSRREEEMGQVVAFFRPRTSPKGYNFYSQGQSSTVIKSKMAATTILRIRTRFRPPKIRPHCRLDIRSQSQGKGKIQHCFDLFLFESVKLNKTTVEK